ncbi:hypothetical protein [Planctomycetes bacterium Pan216]|uniref:hypothetical protein n=1 Tax=Kolteria novifilia TaxID=2527975 RepID=UPI0011A1DC94
MAMVLFPVTLGMIPGIFRLQEWSIQERAYQEPPFAVDGSSSELRRTIVVPTLETPFPDGRNVIWCASAQLAWDRLKEDVVKGPVELSGDIANRIASVLNRSAIEDRAVAPEDHVSLAGWSKEGVVARIRQEMATHFPSVTPMMDETYAVALAYSYLSVSLPFDPPYLEGEEPLRFVDPEGNETPINAFGIGKRPRLVIPGLREQIAILYDRPDEWTSKRTDFVLDLCETSETYQLLVCMIPTPTSFQAALQAVEEKIETGRPDLGTSFGHNDVLIVPSMRWRIDHEFVELGTAIKLRVDDKEAFVPFRAKQVIEFKLDRSGASLVSQANDAAMALPLHFTVDRPFLLVLRNRVNKQPILVVWIDNAELLHKAKAWW